jgi:hypothetical protein
MKENEELSEMVWKKNVEQWVRHKLILLKQLEMVL